MSALLSLRATTMPQPCTSATASAEGREQRSFHAICDRLGFTNRLIVRNPVFAAIGGSALTDPNIAVPAAPPEFAGIDPNGHGAQIPVTYVPFRNAHFLAAAVSWAECWKQRRS